MKLVVLGLSITSSWGNGHATTYRALIREFATRGHEVVFLERDLPWYFDNRDLAAANYPHAEILLYRSLSELRRDHAGTVREADAVVVGSYVPDGAAVGDWVLDTAEGVTAFYDIDTPVTLAKLRRSEHDYLAPALIPRYHLYLSFTGGPTLRRIEVEFGSPCARPLYCSVDPEMYYPEAVDQAWELGYLGTYSADRQPGLESLLLGPARRHSPRRFVVAGPQYPSAITWPANTDRIEHLPPARHGAFYNAQRFTLNLTRADMTAAGWSPSVRLFEAAACGTPIISDFWPGLDEFFEIGTEILVARSTEEVDAILRDTSPARSEAIGRAARKRILQKHTAAHRAAELEGYLVSLFSRKTVPLSA